MTKYLTIKRKGSNKSNKHIMFIKRIYFVKLKNPKHFEIFLHSDLKKKSYAEFRFIKFGAILESQFNSFRKTLSRSPKKKRIFRTYTIPYIPKTRKPSQMRMGHGKGARIYDVVTPIRPGQPLLKLFNYNFNKILKINGVSDLSAKTRYYKNLKKVLSKLPFSFKININLL